MPGRAAGPGAAPQPRRFGTSGADPLPGRPVTVERMRTYHERLRLPASWWALGMTTAVIFASFVWAGFGPIVIVASYLVIAGGPAVLLLAAGATAIEVAGGELRVGRRRLPLSEAAEVTVVDADQSRALRGPRGDPDAVLLFRPYLHAGVFIRLAGAPGSPPYWLVGSRQPAALAAAIEAARPRTGDTARPGDTAVG